MTSQLLKFCMSLFVHTELCVYTHSSGHRNRILHRYRDKDRDMEGDRETDRETDRERERERETWFMYVYAYIVSDV